MRNLYFILILVVFASIFALGVCKIQGYDLWFHMKTGEHILSTGSIPYSDPFSYTAQNPWIAHEWGAGVVYFLVQKAFGLAGLVIFNALLLTLCFFLTFLAAKDRGSITVALGLVYLAALAVRGAERFFIRPDVFTLLFVSAYLYIFHLVKTKRRAAIFVLPFFQLAWANLHGGGSIIGIALIALFGLGEALEQFLRKQTDIDLKPIVLVFLASVALWFANPYGWKVPLYFTHTWGNEFKALLEWRPTTLSDFLSPYGVIVCLAAFSSIAYFRRIRSYEILTFISMIIISFSAIRLIPLAVLSAVAISALGISSFISFCVERFKPLKKVPVPVIGALLMIAVIFFTANIIAGGQKKFGSVYQAGLGLNEAFYPVNAVDFILDHHISGNMFNNYGFGGYLIWRFYPGRKVFIDGRFDVYGEKFVSTYRRLSSKDVWDGLAKTYDLSFALLDNEPSYICRNLDQNSDWKLVFWDDRSLLYVRDLPQNREIINKYAYKYLKPNNRDLSYLNEYLTAGQADKLIEEINRSFEGGRECLNARLTLAYVLESSQDPRVYLQAIPQYEAVLSAIPDFFELFNRIGSLYQRSGRLAEAASFYEKAKKCSR
jgi:hypothetical protein